MEAKTPEKITPGADVATEEAAAVDGPLQTVFLIREFIADPGDPALARAIAERLATYLEHAEQGATLDDAFGLSLRPGHTPWSVIERLEIRNEALMRLADSIGDEIDGGDMAKEILKRVNRYECGARWKRDRHLATPPEGYDEKTRRIFAVLKAGDVPESASQIRRIVRMKSRI